MSDDIEKVLDEIERWRQTVENQLVASVVRIEELRKAVVEERRKRDNFRRILAMLSDRRRRHVREQRVHADTKQAH